MNPTRETQAYIRFGDYVIMQIPLNFVLGKLQVTKDGTEKITSNSRTYHKSYEVALEALYDRLLADRMATPQIDMVRKLTREIKNAKEEIIIALHNNT